MIRYCLEYCWKYCCLYCYLDRKNCFPEMQMHCTILPWIFYFVIAVFKIAFTLLALRAIAAMFAWANSSFWYSLSDHMIAVTSFANFTAIPCRSAGKCWAQVHMPRPFPCSNLVQDALSYPETGPESLGLSEKALGPRLRLQIGGLGLVATASQSRNQLSLESEPPACLATVTYPEIKISFWLPIYLIFS